MVAEAFTASDVGGEETNRTEDGVGDCALSGFWPVEPPMPHPAKGKIVPKAIMAKNTRCETIAYPRPLAVPVL